MISILTISVVLHWLIHTQLMPITIDICLSLSHPLVEEHKHPSLPYRRVRKRLSHHLYIPVVHWVELSTWECEFKYGCSWRTYWARDSQLIFHDVLITMLDYPLFKHKTSIVILLWLIYGVALDNTTSFCNFILEYQSCHFENGYHFIFISINEGELLKLLSFIFENGLISKVLKHLREYILLNAHSLISPRIFICLRLECSIILSNQTTCFALLV